MVYDPTFIMLPSLFLAQYSSNTSEKQRIINKKIGNTNIMKSMCLNNEQGPRN